MADREKDAPAERVVIIDAHESQRRAAEERLRAQQAGEVVQLDKTVPGGKYKSPDGRFHDAHGREIGEDGELTESTYEIPPSMTAQVGGPEVTDAARAGDGSDEQAWRSDMKDQRRESMENPVEGAPLLGESVLPPLEDEEDEVDDSGAKTGRKVKKSARKRSR